MGRFFYAVRKGVKPGVYATWDECKSQVDRFPYASYRKFSSEKDAWAFVRGVNASDVPAITSEAAGFDRATAVTAATLLSKRPLEFMPLGKKRSRSQTETFPSKRVKTTKDVCVPTSAGPDGFNYIGDAVVVYTDGCCFANGQRGARAGIGVYWGPKHPLNVAERLCGRQTNQRAELQAACRALEQAKDMNMKKLILYTDSMFTINGVTSWVKNWKRNGWRLTSGGEVVNKEDFVQLDKLNAELQVVWLHVPGHAGHTGNEQADRLSKEGAVKPFNPEGGSVSETPYLR